MRLFDPRLLKYARSVRQPVLLTTFFDTLTALVTIAQVLLISRSVSPVIEGHAALADVLWLITLLTLPTLLHDLLVATREATAQYEVDHTIRDLHAEVLGAVQALDPRWRAIHASETIALLTRGLDDFDPYFVKFLPQLVLTSAATPLALPVMALLDPWSALITFLTISLVPIFMILTGRLTQDSLKTKLAAMERFSTQLLDLVVGLSTLRGFDREKGPRKHLKAPGREGTRTTISTLYVAFLPGAALKFLATLSVALVAVEVGMRLVVGGIDLTSGPTAIMLAPEVFEPLRQIGAWFHAPASDVIATQTAFNTIEAPRLNRAEDTPPAPGPHRTTVKLKGVSVAAHGTWAPHRLNTRTEPASFTVLAGCSGSGEITSTLTILGLLKATRGSIVLVPEDDPILDLHDVNLASWQESITWAPQTPTLVPGTILDNLSRLDVDDSFIDAARTTSFLTVVEPQTAGWDTMIKVGGVGPSLGQRQRLALTRTLLGDAPLVVLDEPTAHLDAVSEGEVIYAIQALRTQGRTLLVIARRRSLVFIAGHVTDIEAEAASAEGLKRYPELLGGTLPEEIIDIKIPGILADLTTHTSSTNARRECT